MQEKTQQILQLSGAEEKLQGKLKRRNSTVTKLEGELKEREGIVTRLQEELSERKEMTEKGDEVTKLRGELEEKETEFTRLREEKESTVIRLQVELREIEGTVTRLEGEAREREGTVTRLEGEAREREGTVTRLQGELREREGTITRLEGEVTRLQGELGERDTTVNRLQGVLEERDTTVTRLERELGEKDTAVTGLEGELRERQTALSNVQGQLAGQREHYVTELRQVRQEAEQYQRQLREEQVQRQQLVTRIEAAVGYLRGEAVSPQALELWELPREQVHISQTILGTGGWGYVARGTFQGQAVAVKCLHRGILSPQNEGRLRREISIMSQVRHPNLLLLIGAVLTAEGRGPLIVTELLDKSLRSAYEEGLLEERSKVPVLRDVSSALTYLHSHRTPIIHRDVSSANVLLEAIRDGQWKGKLSDFGSANLSHLASTPAEGAAVYAAPEVSTEDRSRQTPKIDVYSFGVLMCEVCLCRFPPERRELPSMLDEVQNGAPHMFPLSRDCTSHAHQDRPAMREVLQRIDQLTAAEAVQ